MSQPVSPITQTQLESYLWGAATLLRGLIDAGDYKQFIFPLLFFKRLCDVYDEESAQLRAELGDDVDEAFFPEIHRFRVPEGAHWRDVRETASDVGRAIQGAMRAIEGANPDRLQGIFGDAPWTNRERLPDRTLRDLIEHFSTLNLSVHNVSEDLLGQAYEYLIKKFADDSGHTAAEFYTNRTVVHLMTLLVDPQPGESIYDPTCGSGGMLLSAVAELKRQGQEHRNVQLYGQERNLMTSAIARMNLFLHGIEDFHVERGDTLAAPRFLQGDRLRRFDVALANPPYSIKQWDRDAWASDPYGRNLYGLPPQGRADYAFFQHILASLDPRTGRCAILFPHGVLFRQEEAHMRARLVEDDVLECVIGLGPNLFYNSPMEACVVVCRMHKPPERRGRVLFVNAVAEVTRERAQSFLEREHINKIVAAYREFQEIPGFTRVATAEQIRASGANLSIPLYVLPPNGGSGSGGEAESLAAAIADWQTSSSRLRESMNALLETLGAMAQQG
jgi:type I restriction enzyme M protein